jgi:hypothetical protein
VNLPAAVAVLPECDLEKFQLTMQAILSTQLSVSMYQDDEAMLVEFVMGGLVFVETVVN